MVTKKKTSAKALARQERARRNRMIIQTGQHKLGKLNKRERAHLEAGGTIQSVSRARAANKRKGIKRKQLGK